MYLEDCHLKGLVLMSKYKKDNKAVALKYNSDSDLAPVTIASGYGEIANKIIEILLERRWI